MMYISLLSACACLWQFCTAHYTQQWALHISGGRDIADQVAKDHGFTNVGEIFPDYYHFIHSGVSKRSARPHIGHRVQLAADERVHWSEQQKAKNRKKRDLKLMDTDPRWPSMWYLNRGNGLDMNVIPAWLEGITGKGAVVTILDDGLEKDHPDLIQNYDPLASYDVNSHDSDPSPRYDMIDSNRHGTRCAGEVAATSNNSVCALGIAHGAQVGGVRMLDGDVTDAVEARSLSLNPQHIDIYSASWGPDDDGKTVDGPGELATRAFIEGVTKGRGGKGSIFVWASGNGGRDHDNCNCDGYTNSIYSLSISSATEQGHVPWYSEACSSTLASTYSSGALGDRQVITTDLHHSCTNSHTGTSASAPLAAGICALALQANPSLTWRDMQHIVVRTARPENLIAPDWQTNGVGRNVSHSFGYGLMDAYAMVKLARKWVTVPEQHKCEITAPHVDKLVPAKSVVVLKLAVNDCDGVQILEHVQAKLSIYTQRRGDLHIQLTSPMGTKVTLLAHRSHDTSRLGFNHWPFMSVHSWGESPFGTWQLEIHNDGRLLARIQKWELVLHGTESLPEVDKIVPPTTAHQGDNINIEHNSIDYETWNPEKQDMLPSNVEKISAENASSGCVRTDSSSCLGLCLAVIFLYRLRFLLNDTDVNTVFTWLMLHWQRLYTRCHASSYALLAGLLPQVPTQPVPVTYYEFQIICTKTSPPFQSICDSHLEKRHHQHHHYHHYDYVQKVKHTFFNSANNFQYVSRQLSCVKKHSLFHNSTTLRASYRYYYYQYYYYTIIFISFLYDFVLCSSTRTTPINERSTRSLNFLNTHHNNNNNNKRNYNKNSSEYTHILINVSSQCNIRNNVVPFVKS